MNYPSSVLSIIEEFQLHADKKRGQCFLTDNNILNLIPEIASVDNNDIVIEIGSGPGNLTSRLCEKAFRVAAFEIDRNLFPIYEKYFKGANVDFYMQDFLKADVNEVIQKMIAHDNSGTPKKIKVVANIPYYITSPIIEKILYSDINYADVLLLIQKDVADRILAKSGSKDYSILSAACAFKSAVSHVKTIGGQCFMPRPDVDSALVRFTPKNSLIGTEIPEYSVFAILKSAFNQRRKVALNSIANNIVRVSEINKYPVEFIKFLKGCDLKKMFELFFSQLDMDLLARAEDITPECYVAAAAKLVGKWREN